jgi:extradiol dioxygenase family protein
MTTPAFHLSLGVHSLDESTDFFVRLLGGVVTHRDSSGYVNITLAGIQLTLKHHPGLAADLPDFHFGLNLDSAAFDDLTQRLLASGYAGIVQPPITVDAGTPLERKKMYLTCPTGYLIELKPHPTT